MKNELLGILAKLQKGDQGLMKTQTEVLDLFLVMLSLPDSVINQKAEEYADALGLTNELQREACTEDLKASAKWRWGEIENILKCNKA